MRTTTLHRIGSSICLILALSFFAVPSFMLAKMRPPTLIALQTVEETTFAMSAEAEEEDCESYALMPDISAAYP